MCYHTKSFDNELFAYERFEQKGGSAMAEPVYIGHALKVLNHKIRRLAESDVARRGCAGLTEAQGRVLSYLAHHPGRDICQRDVEEAFGITRATASKMLGDMEHAGLILRCGADYDARRKNLRLTDEALRLSRELLRLLYKIEGNVDAASASDGRPARKGERLC